jgi:hypothetical protein
MGHVRSNSEAKSRLPIFSVKRSEDYPDWILVTCPREDCGNIFLVQAATWFKRRVYKTMRGEEHVISGRSCPYCFKAARLPSRRGIR